MKKHFLLMKLVVALLVCAPQSAFSLEGAVSAADDIGAMLREEARVLLARQAMEKELFNQAKEWARQEVAQKGEATARAYVDFAERLVREAQELRTEEARRQSYDAQRKARAIEELIGLNEVPRMAVRRNEALCPVVHAQLPTDPDVELTKIPEALRALIKNSMKRNELMAEMEQNVPREVSED